MSEKNLRISVLPDEPLPIQIVKAGARVLRQPCDAVEVTADKLQQIETFARTMRVTLHTSRGVGIAANQLGVGQRIIGIEDKAVRPLSMSQKEFADRARQPVEWYWLINPEFDPVGSGQATWFEGCLSVPDYTAAVPRYNTIRLRAIDAAGQPVDREVSGWHARILQHEIDHLNGHLYLDRMITRSFMHKAELSGGWLGVSVPDIVAQLAASDL